MGFKYAPSTGTLARRWTDTLPAAPDKEPAAQPGQDSDTPETLFSEEPAADAENATKANLGIMCSAISIFYGDLEGIYPLDLGQLTKSGKYLPAIPPAKTLRHPESNSVIFSCGQSQL